MERSEIINVRSSGGTGVPMSKGVEIELEEVEAAHRLYPATIPFLKLLGTLIHTQKRIPLKDQLSEAESINTIPETLGQPYRLPGIGPFVSFVVNNVFSKISSREYAKPSDRWQTNDLCLCFIERCLASYSLESLVSPVEDLQLKGDALIPLLVHPGYEIMKRILSSTPLQTTLLTYIVDGIEGLDKGLAEEEYYFQTTMIRVLRIVLRVLEIQDIFLDILVPALSEFDSSPFVGTVHTRSYFTRLDQALTFSAQTVPAIVAYILYPQYPEMPLLSVKILSCLASSTNIHNLNAIIDRSADSERILAGYQKAMDVEAYDDVIQAETTAEQYTGAGAPDLEGPPEVLPQATRLAILDFLLANTSPDRPYPNTAHFLLFGGLTSDQQIKTPTPSVPEGVVYIPSWICSIPASQNSKGKDVRLIHNSNHSSPSYPDLPSVATESFNSCASTPRRQNSA
jgi:nuclear pore complex protein Nup205